MPRRLTGTRRRTLKPRKSPDSKSQNGAMNSEPGNQAPVLAVPTTVIIDDNSQIEMISVTPKLREQMNSVPAGSRQPPLTRNRGAAGVGRTPGIPNKSTTLAREAIAKLVDASIPQMQSWLKRIAEKDPAAAFRCLMDVMEYHIPRLQRTEVVGSLQLERIDPSYADQIMRSAFVDALVIDEPQEPQEPAGS